MRIIKLVVDNYELGISPDCDLQSIDFKSDRSLFVQIKLSDIWTSIQKTIIFQTIDGESKIEINDRSEAYIIPKEVIAKTEFKISILGEAPNLLIRTNEVYISTNPEEAVKLVTLESDGEKQDLVDYILRSRLADQDTEEHIVINPDRTITVPESLKKIAVQYDHNIETVTFDCPRYWDEHDMSKMSVYIIYQTTRGAAEPYKAKNVVVDETNDKIMHFDWTVSRNVTNFEGIVQFLVCTKKTDSEGNEAVHWNTEVNNDLFVSKGLPHNHDAIIQRYPDLVTQLYDLVELLKDGNEVAY